MFSSFSKVRSNAEPSNNVAKPSFWSQLSKAIVGKSTVDSVVLDAMEELLLVADVVRFDNTYSYMNSKEVNYLVEILEPDTTLSTDL